MLLYINGIPLVVLELKNPVGAQADVWKAWQQIQTYKEENPQLFEANLACVIADGEAARVGSFTAPRERYMRWRVLEDERDVPPPEMDRLEVLIRGLCWKDYLLAFLHDFVLFQQGKQLVKIIAQYHPFHGVRAAVAKTLEAAPPNGDKKGGVFWHTRAQATRSKRFLTTALPAGSFFATIQKFPPAERGGEVRSTSSRAVGGSMGIAERDHAQRQG